MTVHGAKGLEAPVVILADTVNVPTTQKELVFFSTNEEGQRLPLLAISEEARQAPQLIAAKQEKTDALLAEYYRLFYVALTRARDALHIFGTASKKGEVKPKSWYALAEAAMQALGAEEHDGKRELRDIPTLNQSPMAAHARFSEVLALPEWIHASAPAMTQEARVLSPSQLAGNTQVSAYAQAASGDLRTRGVRIHRILELLRATSDREEIAALIALVAPDWDVDEQAYALEEIAKLHAAERWLWEYPSQAEVTVAGTITIHNHDVAISGQIDRLIELPQEVVILDYKTGRHIPSDASEIAEQYRLQLKAYQALVSKLYPTKHVRTALVWTATARLMWCDEVVAATAWPNEFVIHSALLAA
jgi:ATP-dependent helicase/nuclease subunit A